MRARSSTSPADVPLKLALPPALAATLVLVRHGESTWIAGGRFQGRKNPPLSDLGRRQAYLVAERLAQRDRAAPLPIPGGLPVGIWHSPLTRAADTARPIAAAMPSPVPLLSNDGLAEIAQGEWEGVLQADVNRRWAAELSAWRRSPATSHAPGGESLPDAESRVTAALIEVTEALEAGSAPAANPPAGDDAVAGYPRATGSIGRPAGPWVVLVAHDGVLKLTVLALLGLPLERFWSFPFDLCAISVVSLRDGTAALRAHNLADHLAPLTADRPAGNTPADRRGAL
jgi:probable phosphoglycerate mutase